MLTLLYGMRGAREEIYRLIRRDTDEERRAYLIVPDQKALLAESDLSAALPPSAALLCDAVGFSRLANLVCRRFGSLTYRYATDGAKALVMYRAQKKLRPMLKIFGGDVRTGTLGALCSLWSEMRAASVTPDDLAAAADRLPPSPLSDKLRDLSLLFSHYDKLLHENFADETDDLDTLCELLAAHDFFEGAAVYIDSFVSFTKQQITVLSRMLAQNVDVTIALPYRRGGGAHLAECADTRTRLLKLAARLGVRFDERYVEEDENDGALSFAKAHIWDFACCETYDKSTEGELELIRCADRREEARMCAREIFRAVSAGASYGDIAVIMRTAADYDGILDRYLSRCKIPIFFSKKTDAALLPLTRLILSALALCVYDFRATDVSSYIKTGLCGLSSDECDLFEEYITRWNISGARRYLDGENFTMARDGYTAEDVDPATLADVNEVKAKFAAPLSRLADSLSRASRVRDFAAAIYDYLTDCDIKMSCTRPEAVRYFGVDRTADAIRLWNVTLDALDTLVDAAGDEETTAAEFSDLVELLFSNIDISAIPTSIDQVIAGSADTVRIDKRKFVILLGVNEGVFPSPVAESPTLCEAERRSLAEVGVKLSQNLALRSASELFHFVRAFDFASERVVLSYCTSGKDGKAALPSFAIERLNRVFGENLYTYAFSDLGRSERLSWCADAAEEAAGADGAFGKALRDMLEKHGVRVPPVFDGDIDNGSASLSPETALALTGEPLCLSQSRLDTYGNCRLQYFFKYMLSLKSDEPFSFAPSDSGTYVHSVLERFMRDAHESKKKFADFTKDELREISARLCAEETERVMRSCNGGSARILGFFARLQKNVELILGDLCAEFAAGDCEPLLFEYKIGMGNGHKPLMIQLPDGGSALLRGIADRVDVCRRDGKVYLRIVDYKTGDKAFKESDLEKGKNLQLLIYLFTLCKVADKGFFHLVGVNGVDELVPAGATYYVVKAPTVKRSAPPHADEDIFSEAAGELRRSGILLDEETLAGAIDRTAERRFSKKLTPKDAREMDDLFETVKGCVARLAADMRAGKIDCGNATTGGDSPCRYCDFAAVCRAVPGKGDSTDA